MTRQQAWKLYTDISALVYVFEGDLRQKCLQRGIPPEFVDEFIESDKRFNKFLRAYHSDEEKKGSSGGHPDIDDIDDPGGRNPAGGQGDPATGK